MNLQDVFENKEFIVTCECIPGRGSFEVPQEKALETARAIYQTGRVHAISLTDNPGGNPALLADAVAAELGRSDIETLIHFSVKDRNRNQILAQLYALERAGLHNILLMSGDYQASGYAGMARPVFDLDCIESIQLVTSMNNGLEVETHGKTAKEKQTHFFAGAVVNPFKYTQAETTMQYLKLEKKLQAGARFIVSQLGYDARKMQELMLYLRHHAYQTDVLANVFVTNRFVASLMKNGTIAGTHVSDEFYALLEKEGKLEDKGAAARIERAANQVALAKHFGYRGVHLGGFGVTEKEVCAILDRAAELDGSSCKCFSALDFGEVCGFYLYPQNVGEHPAEFVGEHPSTSGANGKHPNAEEGEHAALTNEAAAQTTAAQTVATQTAATQAGEQAAQAAIQEIVSKIDDPAQKKQVKKQFFKHYRLSMFFHKLMLTPDKGLYPSLKKRMNKKEQKKGKNFKHTIEHAGKAFLYGCKDCGDCGLEACLFQCPMASCPKNQRNGPCGGSMNGFCEVHPQEKLCIWYIAYVRACKSGNFEQLETRLVPPNNWELQNSSAWSNYTHARDNLANTQNISIGNKHLK